MLPGRGQARAVKDAEEVRFADVESLLAAERAGPLVDCHAFRGGLATGPGGGEEGVDVGVASEVSDKGSHRANMELEVLGELVGGCAFGEGSTADLVAAVRRGIGLLEEARELFGASHRS